MDSPVRMISISRRLIVRRLTPSPRPVRSDDLRPCQMRCSGIVSERVIHPARMGRTSQAIKRMRLEKAPLW